MSGQRGLDGRGMSPPEPLEATLSALDTLAPGEELLVLLYCEPVPLYSVLKENGYVYSAKMQPDGTNEIRIRKA